MSDRIPHLRVPFRIGRNGAAETVDQDTDVEVAQSIRVLLGTRPGERLVVPDYGLDDPTFLPVGEVLDASVVADLVARWEDRANVRHVRRAIDDSDVAVTVEVE